MNSYIGQSTTRANIAAMSCRLRLFDYPIIFANRFLFYIFFSLLVDWFPSRRYMQAADQGDRQTGRARAPHEKEAQGVPASHAPALHQPSTRGALHHSTVNYVPLQYSIQHGDSSGVMIVTGVLERLS